MRPLKQRIALMVALAARCDLARKLFTGQLQACHEDFTLPLVALGNSCSSLDTIYIESGVERLFGYISHPNLRNSLRNPGYFLRELDVSLGNYSQMVEILLVHNIMAVYKKNYACNGLFW